MSSTSRSSWLARFGEGRASQAQACLLRTVEGPGGCWIWQGATDSGYARANIGRRNYRVHRLLYEAIVGPVPAGLHLDHLCRVRSCVNPDHLEPVTAQENIRRGVAARPVCGRAHERTTENIWRRNDGRTECLPCRRMRRRVNSVGARPATPDPLLLERFGTPGQGLDWLKHEQQPVDVHEIGGAA